MKPVEVQVVLGAVVDQATVWAEEGAGLQAQEALSLPNEALSLLLTGFPLVQGGHAPGHCNG